jgi:PhnB protein
MSEINTYLIFNGDCADAMRFYQTTLGGKLEMMTHGQSPMADQMPPGSAERILHSRLDFDGGVLGGMDGMASEPNKGASGFSLSLVYKTPAEAKGIFEALAKGGKVTMPFEKTFWAEGFGMLVDRFGTPWMINGAMVPTV